MVRGENAKKIRMVAGVCYLPLCLIPHIHLHGTLK
jgi:hypothetical protein